MKVRDKSDNLLFYAWVICPKYAEKYEEESERKLIRQINLRAEANDKEIEPLCREISDYYAEENRKYEEREEAYYREYWEEVAKYGLLAEPPEDVKPIKEPDFNKICNKYIEIKLLTYDECKEIEGAGEYLGF